MSVRTNPGSTPQDQFEAVQARTSNNFTYQMGSHAMQYGQLDMTREPAGEYIGMDNRGVFLCLP